MSTEQKIEDENAAQKQARQDALTKGYTAATKRLRSEHLAEFNQLRIEETKKLGYDWTPEPTAEEKALAEARALIAAHPSIAHDLIDEFAPTDFKGEPDKDDA